MSEHPVQIVLRSEPTATVEVRVEKGESIVLTFWERDGETYTAPAMDLRQAEALVDRIVEATKIVRSETGEPG